MNKIKKFYRENRVFAILMIITLVCCVLILFGLLRLFFGTGSDKYGDRLEGIKSVEISDNKALSIRTAIEEDSMVNKASVSVMGKIIYISITFNKEATLEDAKTKATKSLDSFSEEEQIYYDFNFTIKQASTDNSEGFLLMGSKNNNGNKLEWNNNRVIEEDSE